MVLLLWGEILWAQSEADSTWPMFHHDLHHTGLSPLTGDMDTCYLLWSYATGDRVYSSPALGDIDEDGNLEVVVGSDDNNVYALNGEDGNLLWSYTTGSAVRSSPALGDIDEDGNVEVVVGSWDFNIYALNGEDIGVEEDAPPESEVFFVTKNKPNPFAVTTAIEYRLPENANVNITIYNLMGRKVVTLVDEHKNAGNHTVRWDGRDNSGKQVPSGIYFLKFQAGSYIETKKIILFR